MKIKDFPPDKIVYTTKTVAQKVEPIFYVSFDQDGDLQVFGNEENDESNAMIVSLQQIIQIDKSILSLPDIQKGEAYIRMTPQSDWEIFKG
jgi:hypothetical protein